MCTVSVVMSVYREDPIIIRRSIEAIAQQTLKDYEFIIVLDYPSNIAAKKYLEDCALKDSRIHLLFNDENKGQGYSRNKAISFAQSEIIALQDADDSCTPDRLQKQCDYLVANPKVDVVGTGLIYFDFDENKHLFDRVHSEYIDDIINKASPCGHPSIVVRKNVFDRFGRYSTEFIRKNNTQVFVEDYDLFLRWYIAGATIRNIPDLLYIYHRDNINIGLKAKGMLKSVVDMKWKYRPQLKFTFSDYMYLLLQQILSWLPSSLINAIFRMIYYNSNKS